MKIKAIKTRLIQPSEPINAILDQYIPLLAEKSIIAVTSKILSFCQGRLVPKDSVRNKYALVEREADACLGEEDSLYGAHLTIKGNVLVPIGWR